jgi:hypothetical protein
MNLGLQILLSFLGSWLLVIAFNFYNINKLKWIPRQLKTWIKIVCIAGPIFFLINAFADSGWFRFFDFGDSYQSLPTYLTFFATLFTAYLLYRTLTSQSKANEWSAFENRFFKFMDYHRENVLQIEYRDPRFEGEKIRKGTEVFTVIYNEICGLLSEIQKQQKLNAVEEKISAIDLVFQCVFYGAGSDGIKILNKNLPNHPLFKLIDFEQKKAEYGKAKETGEVFYSGHVRRLGHYFRNIYQAVSYVEAQKFLTEKEKYEYVTHFRAQMSAYEQSIFFFNSLSSLGMVWEWEEYSKSILNKSSQELREIYKELWITKYDLLRNTLNNDGEITAEISIKSFYPLINLERVEECTTSGILPFLNNRNSVCRFCFNEKYIGYKNEDLDKSIKKCLEKDSTAFDNFNCSETNCKTTIEINKHREKAPN